DLHLNAGPDNEWPADHNRRIKKTSYGSRLLLGKFIGGEDEGYGPLRGVAADDGAMGERIVFRLGLLRGQQVDQRGGAVHRGLVGAIVAIVVVVNGIMADVSRRPPATHRPCWCPRDCNQRSSR